MNFFSNFIIASVLEKYIVKLSLVLLAVFTWRVIIGEHYFLAVWYVTESYSSYTWWTV